MTKRRWLIMNLIQLLYPCLSLSPIIKSWQYSCFQWELSPGKFQVLQKHHLKIHLNTLVAKHNEPTGCLNVKSLEKVLERTHVSQGKSIGSEAEEGQFWIPVLWHITCIIGRNSLKPLDYSFPHVNMEIMKYPIFSEHLLLIICKMQIINSYILANPLPCHDMLHFIICVSQTYKRFDQNISQTHTHTHGHNSRE